MNPNIVRGLDYYTHTVFEVTAEIKDFGSQNVLCAGGRYDNLVKNLNGPETPGVGFALGMERLFNALEAEKINLVEVEGIDVYISYMSENEKAKALRLCMDLRLNGFKVEIDYMNRSLKSNFKQADHLNSKFIIIIGEEEINNNFVTIKNNKTKEEQKVELEYLIYYLDEMLSNNHECTCDDDCDCGCDCNCNHE